jgi:predicted O-methyltransferase YrrM
MFNDMPAEVQARMDELETQDLQEREDGTPPLKRLRQVPNVTGKFLALLAANAPDKGAFLEIGTSGGYSALWITRALTLRKETKLVTFELLKEKAEIARETFKKAKVEKLIEFINGDARGHVADYAEIAFCFLDCEKEMYEEVYDLVTPNLVPGAILVADNVISHEEALAAFVDKAENDTRLDAMVATVGSGLLVCRKR